MPRPWLERFHRLYYEERTALRRRDSEGWIALQRPYPHLRRLLLRHGVRGRVAVLTARDRASLEQLLGAWGLDRVIAPERIYDKETGVRKTAHLARLCGDLAVPPGRVTFVDDKLNHLRATAPLGVRGLLAGWGHNGPREHAEARRLGFPVVTEETAARLLFGVEDDGSTPRPERVEAPQREAGPGGQGADTEQEERQVPEEE
ncbi:MAG TPA: hypothetical protein ENK19_12135 [Acidobacteria bacterium]|nr:hypothetical protein [Acidobacteriota bacterium]